MTTPSPNLSVLHTDVHSAYSLQDYIGRTGRANVGDFEIDVKVSDARTRFGHLDLLVTPVAGSGTRWVEQHRVTLDEPALTA